MADRIAFELVSPERLILSVEADMVTVPGGDGDFGALPRHAPLISTVRPGVIGVYENGAVVGSLFVAGGFVEVTGERCTVLADEAVPLDELDRSEVEREIREAREDASDTENEQVRKAAERRIALGEAKLAALGG